MMSFSSRSNRMKDEKLGLVLKAVLIASSSNVRYFLGLPVCESIVQRADMDGGTVRRQVISSHSYRTSRRSPSKNTVFFGRASKDASAFQREIFETFAEHLEAFCRSYKYATMNCASPMSAISALTILMRRTGQFRHVCTSWKALS